MVIISIGGSLKSVDSVVKRCHREKNRELMLNLFL